MISNILTLLQGCTTNKVPIELPKIVSEEISILLDGGVKQSDFENAIDIWVNMRTPVSNSYGFIRNMALKLAAERLQIILENQNG